MLSAEKIMEGVFKISHFIGTQNLVPGKNVYGEELLRIQGAEYRLWNPNRSKTAAAIKKGLRKLHIKKGSKILYLGAAEGTTISHLSDIVGEEGLIFGVDISERSMRKFIYLCELRKNLVPILSDASQPMTYKEHLEGIKIDALFQDVSQKNQAEIFLRNARTHLKKGGYGFLAIKARSISASEPVGKIVDEEVSKLHDDFKIIDVINLEPFEKEHAMVYCKKK